MNILVIGAGGREHALAWKLKQSPLADRVFAAPGNAGTAADCENVPIAADDLAALVKFAREQDVGLTVVGPEAPLVAGAADAFIEAGLRVFGPSKAASELEGSKAFCRQLLRRADVASPEFRKFRDAVEAEEYINNRNEQALVVKADGLAAGKGVIVCETKQEAREAVRRIAREREFGDAGKQLIIEEKLEGIEASVLAITDGRTIVTLPPAQDHKPAFDGDSGPNTGGMGAYCPTPLLDDDALRKVEADILVPTVHALKRARRPFRGVLYAGLMLTKQGPKVLEYNVRFGDPECQPTLMRLKTDLVELLVAAADGRLEEIESLEFDPRPAVCVVMASEGYPGDYPRGDAIRGLAAAAALPDVKVFHAGTALDDEGRVVSAGGRVLGVTALGDTIALAKLQAYTAVKAIRWRGAWCRKDIADKALASA